MARAILLFSMVLAACGPRAVQVGTPVPEGIDAELDAGLADASLVDTEVSGRAELTPAPAVPAMTFAEALAWLRAELPEESARLRPFEEDDGLLDRLLDWAPPEGTIDVYDRSCRKLELTRNESSLDGSIHLKTVTRGRTKTVSGDSISFAGYVTVVCGFQNEYERTASGSGWRPSRTTGTSSAPWPAAPRSACRPPRSPSTARFRAHRTSGARGWRG
ncbi:MAG: hypothetical protein M0R80_09430 [Proteobacteria bacterium]|jgi:hypothetical protein|nr:hypothetical protein [Pseudomonadota bacterium]